MIDEQDLAHCRRAIRHGSKSFYAASRLMAPAVRDRALALYAFCRLADDAVDLNREKHAAVASLRARLDRAYAGAPANSAVERAFAAMIRETRMPRALPDALVEGLEWDADGRRYRTLSDVRAYSARVASAVGVMMSVLMGVRDRDALARACDLGVAMQLTNIARDIGEDAAEGRLYLPLAWFDEMGMDPDAFLARPHPDAAIAEMVRRLLAEAKRLYRRSEAGIAALPRGCRVGIYAARYIYAGIGRHIAASDYDSVTRRAHTGLSEKIGLMLLSFGASVADSVMPRSPILHAPPLSEVGFLIEAAEMAPRAKWPEASASTILSVFETLAQNDVARRSGIDQSGRSAI